jgi:hypothetical protein
MTPSQSEVIGDTEQPTRLFYNVFFLHADGSLAYSAATVRGKACLKVFKLRGLCQVMKRGPAAGFVDKVRFAGNG